MQDVAYFLTQDAAFVGPAKLSTTGDHFLFSRDADFYTRLSDGSWARLPHGAEGEAAPAAEAFSSVIFFNGRRIFPPEKHRRAIAREIRFKGRS